MANYTNHSNNKPLTPEQIAEIRHLVEVQGQPKTQVAKYLRLSYSVVRKYTTPDSKYFIPEETKRQAVELVQSGISRSAAAKHLGISRAKVGLLIPGEKPTPLTAEKKSELLSAVQQGNSVTAVARSMKIDQEHARNLVKRATTETLSKNELEAIFLERIRLGHFILPMAKAMGIAVNRAYELAKPLMEPPSLDQLAEIKRHLVDNQEPEHISKELGIRLTYVYEIQDEPKQNISDGKYLSQKTKARAVKLLSVGLSAIQVGSRLNITRQQVGLISSKTKGKTVDDLTKQKIVEGIRSGKSIAALARSLGIDKNWAHKIAEVEIPPPTPEEANEMRRLRAAGQTYHQISIALKTHQRAVTAILGDQGPALSAESELAIAKAFSTGLAQKEVADQYGISSKRVRKIYESHLAQKNVEPRPSENMEDDRNLEKIRRLYPGYEAWRQYALSYYKVVKGNFAVLVSGIHRFFQYLVDNKLYQRPADFFLRANRPAIPSFFESSLPKSDHGASINNAIVDFLDWILLQDEFVDVDDDEIPITLPIFRNPLEPERRGDHSPRRNAESTKRVMPYFMVHDLRRRIIQGPNFADWTFAQTLNGKETLSGDKESREWFEVTPGRIDSSDPDCVSRVRSRADGSTVMEMWSPVRTAVLLLKLQTTARLGQIRMLDSGEADSKTYADGKFVNNDRRLKTDIGRQERSQGAIREGEGGTAILYFNTNKTQDINKFGEEKGQECPWPHLDDYRDDPYWLIAKLSRWQSKFNPIANPVKWADIPSTRRLRGKSERVCASHLDTCFLFRTPEDVGQESFPITYSSCLKTWHNLMVVYEELLMFEGVTHSDGSRIELTKDGRALITPHGLRTSLITHLILDAGMPIEMMVRIVGHMSFLMTIYYVKPGLARLQEALKSATHVLQTSRDHTLIRDLRSMKLETLRDRVVCNAQELADIIPDDPSLRNPLGWLEMPDGICLAGGNTGPVAGDYHIPGCHNGGPPLSTNNGMGTYGPTPGGSRNCCRCRWRCSGKKHLIALQAMYNNKNFHRSKASQQAIECEKKRFAIHEAKAKAEANGNMFLQHEDLIQAERRYLASMQRMEHLVADMISIQLTIDKILALPDEPGTLALTTAADTKTLKAVVEDVNSETLVLAEICEDIQFWPELDAGTAVFELTRLLDVAFEREGHPLKLSHLSDEEQLVCCNAIMRSLELRANPTNPRLGRKIVAQTIDRAESLTEVLGVKSLSQIIPATHSKAGTTAPILLTVNG